MSQHKQLVDEVAELIHSDRIFDAARLTADRLKINYTVDNKEKAYEVLNVFLHWLLNNKAPKEAAQLLWSPTLFSAESEATRSVWDAFEQHNFILLMGAASMSKSYSMGVRLMLEWIRDPEYTTVQVVGPSENHLEDNLFSHLVTLHRSSAIPLPGVIGKLFIGLDSKSRKGAIRGVVIPLGKRAAGRIQGTKRVQRKKPHPIFGPLTRMFIFLDEMVNIPKGIWKDLDNVMSMDQGDDGLKVAGAFNPTDQNDKVGQQCEPPFGWLQFDPDKHFGWMSTRGWYVVRLDAKYSENVVQGRVIFPGLQTKEGFDRIIRNSGGTDSPGYWAMARGCFPPLGVCMAVIPGGMLNKVKGEFIWFDVPNECAGVDLALTGKDSAIFAKGKFGIASGIKLPPSLEYPNGVVVYFKDSRGKAAPRFALQLESLLRFPKGDTIAMAEQVIKLCKQTSVKPDWLCLDKTGNGQGVYDYIRNNWSYQIHGVNYTEACTDQKIMSEDTQLPAELYDRVNTELWFAMRMFIEFDALKVLPSLDTGELFPQLSGRWFRATGKKCRVEPKDEYELRNQAHSPDEADAVSQLVHGVRLASRVTLGMTSDTAKADIPDDEEGVDHHWVDSTNRNEDL